MIYAIITTLLPVYPIPPPLTMPPIYADAAKVNPSNELTTEMEQSQYIL